MSAFASSRIVMPFWMAKLGHLFWVTFRALRWDSFSTTNLIFMGLAPEK